MKVAVFGVWHVHAPDYTRSALEHGEVVGFYERDDLLAENFAKEFGLPRFNTPEELLSSEAEGVIVCSASKDHGEDIVRIAEDKKDIFTEKVLALTSAECERIKEAVERNGVRLVISLFQKYSAKHIALKSVVDSGELGKVNFVRFRNCHSGSTKNWLPTHFYNREQCGGGAMIDLGAHGMYLIHWILGLPKRARSVFTISCESEAVAKKNCDKVEDNAVTVMEFEGGAIAVNETGFVSGYSPVVLEVFGENGYVKAIDGKVFKRSAATGGTEVEVELGEDLPRPIVQFLKNEIHEGCGMDEALALTKMMELAYEG